MPEDEDRKAILSRRNRLVAIALSGLASASTGCYEAHLPAGTAPPGRDAGVDSGFAVPCLGAPFDAGFDSGLIMPGPCLSAPAADAGPADAAEPTPCLDFAPEDAGPDDAATDAAVEAGPTPCLTTT